MEEARIDALVRLELELEASEEALVRGEAEMGRDARAGAVGADEVAGGEVDAIEADEGPVAAGAFEAGAAQNRRAGIASPASPSSAGDLLSRVVKKA